MRSVHVFCLLLLAGCAALPKAGERPVREAVVLDGPAEALWGALPIVYDSLGYEGAVVDTAERSIWSVRIVALWTPWIGPARAPHMRCTVAELLVPVVVAVGRSGGSLANVPIRVPPANVTLTVSTRLADVDGRTRVQTRVSAVPTDSRTNSREVYCVSTGRLEDRVVELLRARLESGM